MCRCASIFKRKRDFAGKITQKINSHVTLAQALYCLCKKTIWRRSMHYHNGLWIGRARTKAVVAKRFLNYTRFVFKPLNIVGNHDDNININDLLILSVSGKTIHRRGWSHTVAATL